MPEAGHIRSTLKHASIYGASSILGKFLGFLMLPIYAHYLRGEGYGMVGMIDVVLSVLAVLIGNGITGAMSRFYFERTGERERRVLISTAILLLFGIVVVVCAPALFFAGPIARLAFGEAGSSLYIVLAVLAFIAEMTSKNAHSYILIKQRSVLFSILSLLRLFFGFALNIYFIVHLELGVLGYLYASLAIAVLFTVVMHIYALADTGLHYNRQDARQILQFSLPLIPGYIAFFVRSNACRIMLRIFHGLTLVGAYEMMFKFATLIGILIVEPFTRIWAVKQLEICETGEGAATMARFFTLQLAIMLFAGLVLSLEIPILLRLLTPEEFWLGGTVAFLAVTSRILIAVYNHMSFGLFYAKLTARISMVQMVTAAVNVIANLALIPSYGIAGAVAASCLTAFVHCVLAYRMSSRHYYIPFEWGKVARMCALYFGLFLAISFLSMQDGDLVERIARDLQPYAQAVVQTFHLDRLRDGRWARQILERLPLIVDGVGRLLMSLFFLLGLFGYRVFSARELFRFMQHRPLGREVLGENLDA